MAMSDRGLTHLDPLGRARMVDVTPKEPTHRRAIARGRVHHEHRDHVAGRPGRDQQGRRARRWPGWPASRPPSGTPDLIPLCHPLLVGAVLVNFRIEDNYIEVEAQVETVDRTGVEMEALTAVQRGLPDDLRHVQVGRPLDGHQRRRAVGEDRRTVRGVSDAPGDMLDGAFDDL